MYGARTVPDFFIPPQANKFESTFNALIEETKLQKYGNDVDTEIKFLEILSLLIKSAHSYENKAAFTVKNMEIINKAIDYIDENYSRNISLYDIANYVHLSKIYFHNFFLKATGQTPHDYLQTKRINNVKFLLTATDKSFSEIAHSSGFASQAYMTYVFKKKMNCTPMQYKKRPNSFYFIGNKKLAFFGLLCYTVYIKIHIIYIMPLKLRRIGDESGRKKYYKN